MIANRWWLMAVMVAVAGFRPAGATVEDEIKAGLEGINPQEQAGDADDARIRAEARALAKLLLPAPPELGETWRYPWQFSVGVQYRVGSEDEFWKGANIGIAGMSEAEAQKSVGTAMANMKAGGADEAQGRLLLIGMMKSLNGTAADRYLEGLEAAARAFAGYTPPPERPQTPAEQDAAQKAAEKRLLDALSAPYAGKTPDQILADCARLIALPRKRTLMTYGRSNNWSGMDQVRSDKDFAEKKLWATIANVKLMLVSVARTNEFAAPDAAGLKALQARLDKALKQVLAESTRIEEAEIAAAARRAEAISEDFPRQQAHKGVAERRERLAKQKESVREARMEVKPLVLGDGGYEIALAGVRPELLQLSMTQREAWFRVGTALVDISFESLGPVSEAQMAEEAGEVSRKVAAKVAAGLKSVPP
jgi:hypothetical protein